MGCGVRCRSGEANVPARIARAMLQSALQSVDIMAGTIGICHNLGDNDSLGEHLLSGLSTAGVPKSLRGVVHTFEYKFDKLPIL